METKRLIPYSVHLPEDIYRKLKAAAGERKASALVRDAITLIINGGTAYNSGYNKGLKDCIKIVESEALISGLVINGKKVEPALTMKMEKLTIKEKANGTKKGRGD
jgi:hypothetical protein